MVNGPSLTKSTFIGAEDAMCYVFDILTNKRQEVLVELVGDIGCAGIRKRWAATVAAVGEQRELRHHEHLAVDIGKRQVGLAVLVLVNTQAPELAHSLSASARVSPWPTPSSTR